MQCRTKEASNMKEFGRKKPILCPSSKCRQTPPFGPLFEVINIDCNFFDTHSDLKIMSIGFWPSCVPFPWTMEGTIWPCYFIILSSPKIHNHRANPILFSRILSEKARKKYSTSSMMPFYFLLLNCAMMAEKNCSQCNFTKLVAKTNLFLQHD